MPNSGKTISSSIWPTILKTPLTSVIGYLSLLRDEPQISAELRARYTGIALEKALRLEDLINEFFEITRFNLTHLSLETTQIDLVRMLEQLVSEFAPILDEKQLRCILNLPEKLELECDPDKLARVFDNLLRNACNYSFPDSAIAIGAKQAGQSVVLTITNSGKTIPREKLERIFDQFFRLDSLVPPAPADPAWAWPLPKKSFSYTAAKLWLRARIRPSLLLSSSPAPRAILSASPSRPPSALARRKKFVRNSCKSRKKTV